VVVLVSESINKTKNGLISLKIFFFLGGEGAIIAARGAPLGIGSDIGGSIRIPAHFCGVFGFKPTPGRLTRQGVTIPSLTNEAGETNIRPTIGPLARCTDDLVLVMRSLLQENAWLNDPQLDRQPWRDERFKDQKRLTIGFYTNDNWFPPAPACIRAVNEAADALRKLGHTVVPYTPIDIPEAVRIFTGIIGADGNKHFLEALENEEINPLYTPLLQAAKLPNFLRPFIACIMRFIGERRNALIVESVGSKTAYEYFDLVIELKLYVQKWLDDLRKNNIDLLLVSKVKQNRVC
jgi:fatty acid amide hydrolase